MSGYRGLRDPDDLGETTYEWMEGGFFLIGRGQLRQGDNEYKHIEIIGYDRAPDATGPADVLTSRIYTTRGETLDYTHEVDDKSVTSWFGPKGSPAVFRAEWSGDGNTLAGAWEWPGGGYKLTLSRVTPDYYAPQTFREFLWVSEPNSTHSRNLSVRPDVSIVIFDTSVPIDTGQAVYMAATAENLASNELVEAIEVYSRRSLIHGGRKWTPDSVSAPSCLRLYLAVARQQFVLDEHENRVPVTL